MRVAIAGAGNVGQSIATELLANGHEVLLIDRDPAAIRAASVPNAEWLLADACELATLEEAALERCQVVIASSGDDKVNLVVSLLAKTEFGVPRVVARVNQPDNEWLFTDGWGVDVAVSTPRIISAIVEEAVSVGELVRLFTLRPGQANLVELTLPDHSPLLRSPVEEIAWPHGTSLVAVVRGDEVHGPRPDLVLDAGDELVFLAAPERENELEELLAP